MNKGRATCDKLKAIRKAIAAANGIEYNPEECTFEGNCSGTCPKCDAELKELTRLIAEKEAKGEKVDIPPMLIDEIFAPSDLDDNDYMRHTAGIPMPPDNFDNDDDPFDPWELDGDIKPLQGDICAPGDGENKDEDDWD